MAAGNFGSGKVFLSGHSDFYYNQNNDNPQLVKNIITWMGGEK